MVSALVHVCGAVAVTSIEPIVATRALFGKVGTCKVPLPTLVITPALLAEPDNVSVALSAGPTVAPRAVTEIAEGV